jgi:hypothetical protein
MTILAREKTKMEEFRYITGINVWDVAPVEWDVLQKRFTLSRFRKSNGYR